MRESCPLQKETHSASATSRCPSRRVPLTLTRCKPPYPQLPQAAHSRKHYPCLPRRMRAAAASHCPLAIQGHESSHTWRIQVASSCGSRQACEARLRREHETASQQFPFIPAATSVLLADLGQGQRLCPLAPGLHARGWEPGTYHHPPTGTALGSRPVGGRHGPAAVPAAATPHPPRGGPARAAMPRVSPGHEGAPSPLR